MSVRGTSSEATAAALAGLKDFQRRTVDYVFERLYAPEGPRRFLVADEVGLGKTLVARGVIARAIDHLRGKVDRIDVIYICSNGDIARQNINRLKVAGEHVAFASRLTLLPTRVRELRETTTGVNFVSFTPATSLDVHGGLGQVDERLLLYAMLREIWGFGGRVAPLNVLQGQVGAQRFRDRAAAYDLRAFDPELRSVDDFRRALQARADAARARGERDLRARFDALCDAFATARSAPPAEVVRERTRVVGELRAALAASCVEALEPDLVILDEFQRFGHLLDGDDEASELARALFAFPDVRVLLLSATPYKMYTAADEAGAEDHYRDFVRTLRFLERSAPDDRSLDAVLQDYRAGLAALGEPGADARLRAARGALEARLRRVMVRTERLAATPDRNGMLAEVAATPPQVAATDVLDYLALQQLARACDEPDTLEYWKSAPFVLNFMDDSYQLKRAFVAAVEAGEGRQAMARILASAPTACLPWSVVESYRAVEPGNARMRALLADTVGRGAHRLLWVPPAVPYYGMGGAFADPALAGFTKRLVFSAWRMVPRAVAALVSYEAERQMVGRAGANANTPEARKRRQGLLRFARIDGRLTGMPVLALMYPSSYLARACDPARLAAEHPATMDGAALSLEELLELVRLQIEVGLRRVRYDAVADGPVDERWYWAAPLLLDRALEPVPTAEWFKQPNLAAVWAGEEADDDAPSEERGERDGWREHVAEARAVASGQGEPLGRAPDDLVEVLALLAVAGPGVAMLRAMLRVVGMRSDALGTAGGVRVRSGAAAAAWSFRALFNQPEVMALLRGPAADRGELPYWRQVLRYCADGCLQAVLDEYAHVLRDHLGLATGSAADRVHEIAEEICIALSLRTANLAVDDITLSESGRTLRREARRMRCHFALRFGDERDEAGEVATRADQVRKAFNSPFWPFVVVTTSVGQEGLDFHTYCHAVVHWNLPSNPVDLEQREGRVHRYKGHAVRRNVALVHGARALADGATDVWEAMFDAARRGRAADATDVVPYWVYSVPGGARIERHVPALPLSREREQLRVLTAALAVYRMVFGQPRQDDLLRYLVARLDAASLAGALGDARIDLSPSEPSARE